MGNRKKNSADSDRNVIVGLDLGTTKTCVIVAEEEAGSLNVVGLGRAPSLGMKQGVVVNIEHTVNSIIEAVEAAERMANISVETAFTGITGDHVRSINSRGMIAVGRSRNGMGNKIAREDIQRVIETAQTVTFPADREVLHVIPQDFLVDDREGFKDPVGIVGTRLEANVHIITSSLAAAQTVLHCLQVADVQLEDLVLQSLASSLAVLTDDDRELGVALLDLGGGTTDIAVFHDGSIRHTNVIGLGGEHVTRDLAHGLRLPMNEAEKIKLQHGCSHPSQIGDGDPVLLSGDDNRPERQVTRDILCAIIQPRMEEIFDLAVKELRQAECLQRITAGVVLTGGAAMIPGAVEVAEEVFNLPVRIGKPRGVYGLREICDSPMYATGAGLVLYGAQQQNAEYKGLRLPRKRRRHLHLASGRLENFRRWIGDMF